MEQPKLISGERGEKFSWFGSLGPVRVRLRAGQGRLITLLVPRYQPDVGTPDLSRTELWCVEFSAVGQLGGQRPLEPGQPQRVLRQGMNVGRSCRPPIFVLGKRAESVTRPDNGAALGNCCFGDTGGLGRYLTDSFRSPHDLVCNDARLRHQYQNSLADGWRPVLSSTLSVKVSAWPTF